MQVTDVRVRRIEKEGKMKAIVSITLDNEFVIHDIKGIEGEKGLFIAICARRCLSRCRAEKLLTANTAISPIRSIPEHGT